MKWAILWLILAAAFALGIGTLNVPLFNHLIRNGVREQATAVKLTPEFHNTVRYEYQVGAIKFEGQSQSWLPNPPVEKIKVGEPLVIYYDPLNPSRSVLGDPKPMLTNELISVGMVVLAVPTVIVFRLMQYQRRKHSKGR
jgi:hypothetical protein